MTRTLGALLCAAAVLASGAATAESSYVVDKVTITGSKTVPVETLYAAIQEHKGSTVTRDDIVADQDRILKVLGDASVGGGIKTSMASRGKHIEVTFIINDTGKQVPVVTTVAAKLHAQVFDGNASISSDKLAAASGLKPGDAISNEKVLAAENAILAVYKAAKLPLSVSIGGGPQKYSATEYDLLWHIKETKGKTKKDDRSQDAQDQIQ